jgi:hypothetical protein
VESLVRAKKNIGFTAPTLELPSGYNDNTSFRNNSSPINPATIAAQALSNSSFTRHSDSTDIESYKTTLISKLNEITRKESTIPWGGAEIPVPNIKIDHSVKISEFVGIVKEIDSEFQNHLSALERERKDRIVVQENRITKEVKDQIRKLKGYAVQDFIKSLGSYVMPGDSNDVNGPVPSPSLADDSQSDVSMTDTGDLCTICQDTIIRTVTLPCKHSFCFDCFREYVKDKIDSCQHRKRSIENLIIACPNCKYPYNYLDELDNWLTENGFDVALMWGVNVPLHPL